MAGETRVTVTGNLTADPELRYTQSGLAVVNFTIASTPRVFSKEDNDWKDGEALFLRASAWREHAENIAASLHKGAAVMASGVLKQRTYETKEGEKRTSIELEVEDIGPTLKFATAVVTKIQSNRSQNTRQRAGQPEGQYNPSTGQTTPTEEVWPSAGLPASTYDDETPF